ncbi:MAG: DUF1254 domain-containing protein [Rhodocyclaceae bacterium]|nr:DUF1254 domain-containing protein [Rhodocyclaceae bacterium]
MKRMLGRCAVLFVLTCCALHLTVSAQEPKPVAVTAPPVINLQQAQEDLAFALGVQATIWAYPLVITAATAQSLTATDKPLPSGRAPFNSFGHVGNLVTAASKEVVSPNADTIYSTAFVDLKQGAAQITVPDVGKRYYSLMLEDAYTNVFGYIGTRATGTKAGKYLIVGPGWKGKAPAGMQVIQSPTSLVWIIGRTLGDGEKDLPNVAAIQQQYQIEMLSPVVDAAPIKQRWNLQAKPSKMPVKQVDELDWKTYFTWTAQLMADNPPPSVDRVLISQFSAIGLSVDSTFLPERLSPSMQAGLARGYAAGRQIIKAEAMKIGASESNGWAYNLNAGKWGQDFNLRAAIAYRSLGQNTAEEALYLNTRKDGQGDPLTGNKRYSLTFAKGSLPPVDAFWSVTMYDHTNFFVDNPINRYAIGNRTEGLKFNADGSLTLYFQKDPPTGDQVGNWLPAPDGDFRLSLRLYVPKDAVLNGEWKPPAVVALR